MNATHLVYLENMNLFREMATIVGTLSDKEGKPALILDKTIFYPQGGGQACDVGIIEGDGFRFEVRSVTYSEGIVYHTGTTVLGQANTGAAVTMEVDQKRRELNSRLQSGGHLLLNAMKDAGQTLIATKGYHFPEGPYVEFRGSVPDDTREVLLQNLQKQVDRLISLDLPLSVQFVPYEELHNFCANVPDNVPRDKPTRFVTIDGLSQPCGGTHVRTLRELVGMKVEKIKSKKGDTRVSYSLT